MSTYLLPHERWLAARAELIRRKRAASSPAVAGADSFYGPTGVRLISAGISDGFIAVILTLLSLALGFASGFGLTDPALYRAGLTVFALALSGYLLAAIRTFQGLRSAGAFRRADPPGKEH